MPRHFYKYKLLLDENVPPRESFPQLNNLFNVKHVTVDLKQESLPDPDVYQLAVKQKRIVITFNEKDFYELATVSKDSGVIGISSNLTLDQIDSKLVSLLRRKKPSELYGRFNRIRQ